MERTVDPQILAQALGVHETGILPSPEQLAALIADIEVAAIRADSEVPDQLLGTAWYLHGVAAAAEGTELYDPVRRRHAFAVSAHILELALGDPRHQIRAAEFSVDAEAERPSSAQPPEVIRARRLAMAFGAQIGYRRCEQDPNATAVFRQIDQTDSLLITEAALSSHLDTLAVEAAVAFLGMQRRRLAQLLRRWRSQFRDLAQLADAPNLHGTVYGPAEAVVDACAYLTRYLTRADAPALEQARTRLRDVVTGEAGMADRSARWVAAHLLEFLGDLAADSLQGLLPDGSPPALARTFALSDPPVMTLWPPQRSLLKKANPLDENTRRLLISVPTSAGKTLMAQLIICAHLADHAERVLYVSPLRSLGREMRQALRSRLRVLGRTLAADQPDFPASGAPLTSADSDVEISTPERLMHALRQDAHAALDGVGLIVIDEAHHIQQGERGFLLEGLLAFCQAHPRPPRLVLLSAAVGNHGELAAWLDDEQPPEKVVFTDAWRGPRRLHGLLTPELFRDQQVRRTLPPHPNRTRTTELRVPMGLRISVRPTTTGQTYSMTTRPEEPLGTRIYLEKTPGDTSAKAPASVPNRTLFAFGAAHLARAGSVLVVCDSRNSAKTMARAVAEFLPEHAPAAQLAEFLADTLGAEHPLIDCARHGVAYHHARLPAEVLRAVEDALRDDKLNVICCTSTLTDGVNLPVRSVVIHSDVDDGRPHRWSGRPQMPPAQLLNAVGRAGRAGRESEGWILLTRHSNPRTADYSLLQPGADRLHVLSALGSEDALASLAEAEELIAQSANAVLRLAASQAADFASYVWFTLDALSRIPTLTEQPPLAAVQRLLAMRQLPDELAQRWMRLAVKVADEYAATDEGARRRWTTPGTSIRSARTLDAVAEVLTVLLLRDPAAPTPVPPGFWGEALADALASEWPLQQALDFFDQHNVYSLLLSLPEAKDAWTFTEKPRGRSNKITVDIAAAVAAWIGGRSIPDLSTDWLPSLPPEWALEQTVSNISSTFEHYLSWTLGALINLVNARLENAHATFRLPSTAGWHLRHGVDTPHALNLLNAGITSRRLAHSIGRSAKTQHIRPEDLRQWLTDLHINRWKSDFNANAYETGELLEYTRFRKRSLINDLLDTERCSLQVIPFAAAPEAPLAVRIRNDATDTPDPLTVSDGTRDLARVPADAHIDVLTVLDSGIDIEVTLCRDRLTFRLPRST
ncbi:DEAD/DEAH box helicase [Streptomyces capillispiralis]|uniref:Helicase-like protein n=1 Tax=Streptomyces capillispiralis TaxID=68182 RepID=A0A561TPZ6_9ACTN|nr:DEAD/DEAH box helicase [Streptomyces capillispiralis]TWF89189.1 helicase-like protein [Streptomyces capillispiralis]GHH95359.1 hypothetical protein GCM10017779_58160 [Streptomyces capillispiralis]